MVKLKARTIYSVSKKTWRRIFRVIGALAGLYILLLAGISIYISSSQDRLIKFLTDKMKENVSGELKIDHANITVWRSFPNLGIILQNVSIRDSLYHRTFLFAKEIRVEAGFLDLIGSKLKISSVKVQGAVLFSFIDKNGYTNGYVLKSKKKKETNKKKKPVLLKDIELQNVILIREDVIKNKRYEIKIHNADAGMSMQGSKYLINFNEDMVIRGLGFNMTKGYWLENQRIQAKWKLQFDTAGNIISFDETKVKIQGQPFVIKGAFYTDTPYSHFKVDATTKNLPYATAMAILKPTTSSKIKKLGFSKGINAHIILDGPLAYKTVPLVKVDFATSDNDLTTPVINFNSCTFTGSFINQANVNLPRTDDNTRIIINNFQSKWGDINLLAKNIAVTNLIHPVIQFEFYSKTTLQQLDEELSSSTLRFINGNANVYLSYNGPLIADASLLDQLNAKIQIQNGKIVYVPRNLTFSEVNGEAIITGNNLLVDSLQCNLNTNHFVVTITGDHLNRISSKEEGKANIDCNVYSPAIDLSDFKTLFAGKTAAAAKNNNSGGLAQTAGTIDDAVENGNLSINMKADSITLHHFQANNVVANILFQNNNWEITKAALQHADGSFNLTAKIQQINNNLQKASVQTDLQHINVQKLFYAFDNFGQTGLTSKNIRGILDSKANISMNINSDGKIVMPSMNGDMFFSIKKGALVNFTALKGIQNYVLKNRDLSNLEFAQLKDTFLIKNGDIYIQRMPVQSSALTLYVEGVYSFADRTNISIQVPLSTLVNKPENYKKINKEKAENPGASIYLRAKDKDGQIKIGLDLFKKFRKDKYEKVLNDSL